MNFSRYIKAAIQTESIPVLTYSTVVPEAIGNATIVRNRRVTRLLHASIGLVTETDELKNYSSFTNWVEEIGDCFWYLAIAADELDWNPTLRVKLPSPEVQPTVGDLLAAMSTAAAELLDQLKKQVFYGKALDKLLVIDQLNVYWDTVGQLLSQSEDLTLEKVWEANLKKLAKRYPDLEFNKVYAVERDIKNELSHLDDFNLLGEDTWEQLKGGIAIPKVVADEYGLAIGANPAGLRRFVLNFLGVSTEELARSMYGDEFTHCQFVIEEYPNESWLFLKAIPFPEEEGEAE